MSHRRPDALTTRRNKERARLTPVAPGRRLSCSCGHTRTIYGEITALDAAARHAERCDGDLEIREA